MEPMVNREQVKPSPHTQTIQNGGQYLVFAGEHFRSAQDDAVDGDQGQEGAQGAVKIRHEAVHQKIDEGHEPGNDDDIAGKLDGFGDHVPQQGDHQIGAYQYKGGGKSHAQTVDRLGGDR